MSKAIRLIQFNKYIRQPVLEVQNKEWVLNGKNNGFFDYIINRYNGSPTNAAVLNSYAELTFGRGLVNNNNNIADFLVFKKMLSDKELKKIIFDFVLFGEASGIAKKKRGRGKAPNLYHVPKQNVAPNKANDDNVIEGLWVSDNWVKLNDPKHKPVFFPIIAEDSSKDEMFEFKTYRAGKIYFSDPDYLAGLPYAELEEEIANYYLSHIKNGLSFGYIVNIPDGNSYTEEEKDEIERSVKQKLTGSGNAGKFIINFQGGEKEITVTAITVNSAHKQWEYLTGEARQQLLTSHRVTSPMLFGIKDNTGFGNNADELDVAEAQLMKRVIQPKQNEITSVLEEIARLYGLVLDLSFLPLTEVVTSNEAETINDKLHLKLFNDVNAINNVIDATADKLIDLGEDIDSTEYSLLETRNVLQATLTEKSLSTILQMASVPKSSPTTKSDQDTSLFKIRYVYAGNPNPQREFCRKLMKANKVYRQEDLEAAESQTVNKGLGLKGADTYDIFKYKGGVNCKHFWQRQIYLRKNNKRIGVNEAKRLILELEPKDRKDAKWEKNPKEVSVIASPSNNFWKVN